MKKYRRRKSRKAKRGLYTSTKSNVTYKYRSNWERLYMTYLDASENVTEWSYESIKIPYISNVKTKKIRNYKPDFYVVRDDEKFLIEIKPFKKVQNVTVIKKANAARAWCAKNNVQYQFVTEYNLKALNLL